MCLKMYVGEGQRTTLRSWVLFFHCGLWDCGAWVVRRARQVLCTLTSPPIVSSQSLTQCDANSCCALLLREMRKKVWALFFQFSEMLEF